MNWRERAYCAPLVRAGIDPEAWTGGEKHPDRDAALAVCRQCPVRRECLAEGLENERVPMRGGVKVRVGVWGGLSVKDRDGLEVA